MPNDNFYPPQGRDDWSPHPYDASPNTPAQNQHQPDPSHPLANNAFDFKYYLDVLKLTLMRGKDGSIIQALVLLTTFGLAWGLLTGVVQTVVSFFSIGLAGIVGLIITIMGFLLFPLNLLIYGFQMALLGPASEQLHAPTDRGGTINVLKSGVPVFVMGLLSLLLVGLSISIGFVLCVIPGFIAAFLFYQVPYLTIVHNRSIPEAFQESLDRAKTHWHVLVMTFLIHFAITMALGMATGMFSLGLTFAGGFFAPISYLGMPVVNWVFSAISSVMAVLLMTVTGSLIDELEGIRRIPR